MAPQFDGAGKPLPLRPEPHIDYKNLHQMQSFWLRLVTAKVVTMTECQTCLTIDDIADLNEQIEMEAAFAGHVIWEND